MVFAIVLTDFEHAREIIKEKENDKCYFELRLDADPRLLLLVTENVVSPSRVILTVRTKAQGGKLETGNKRRVLLDHSLELDVEYLDLELITDSERLQNLIENPEKLNPKNLIVSHHNFDQVMKPGFFEFYTTFQQLLKVSNDIKRRIVLKYVGNPTDALETLETVDTAMDITRSIVLGIGRNGDISRTLNHELGQEFAFGGTKYNPDILQFTTLEQLMQPNALRIGLIGKKLSHSASPLIHHLFMQEDKQPGYYHLLEATNEIRTNTLIKRIMEYEFSGLNITFPYKTSVIHILDSLNDDAHRLQAVNTIHMKNGKLLGYNTDISGFTSFMKNHDLHKYNKAMILGAGGASRAVCASLIQLGIEIIVVTRNSKRINEFPEELRSQISFTTPGNIDYKQDVEIYINATPLGLEDNDPREFVQIPSQVKVVIDLLYHRNDTIMVKEVKSSGIEAYDGKEMLFNQAADSYEIWTGSTLDLPSIFKQFIMEFDL